MSGLCDLAEYPPEQRVAIARAELESLLPTPTAEVSPPVAEPAGVGIPIQHAVSWSAIRPRSNDERRAAWAAKYYGGGHHRRPRDRISHTAPGGHPARLTHAERYALEQAPSDPIHDYAAIRGE